MTNTQETPMLVEAPYQHHFVIAFDAERQVWFIDHDTADVFMDGGTVYNIETGDWQYADGVPNDEYVYNQLTRAIAMMNDYNREEPF